MLILCDCPWSPSESLSNENGEESRGVRGCKHMVVVFIVAVAVSVMAIVASLL